MKEGGSGRMEREWQDPGFGGLCEISVSAEGCLRSKLG